MLYGWARRGGIENAALAFLLHKSRHLGAFGILKSIFGSCSCVGVLIFMRRVSFLSIFQKFQALGRQEQAFDWF